MSNINQAIKEKAAPGVIEVIAWALLVHENTMQLLQDDKLVGDARQRKACAFTLDEREEARKVLLEYGAGKPTRIVEHRGSKKQPICFETEIVQTPKQLPETIDAEFVTNEAANT